MKVYVVMCGEYSDKYLGAAFSDKSAAERWANVHDGYVTELEVDSATPVRPEDEICWRVRITDRDMNITRTDAEIHGAQMPTYGLDQEVRSKWGYDGTVTTTHYVMAPYEREDLAIKIAMDRRAIANALGGR